MNAWVNAARVVSTKALDGRLVALYAPGLSLCLHEGMTIFFAPPQLDAPRSGVIKEIENDTAQSCVFRLNNVSDKSTAQLLIDCHVLIQSSDVQNTVCNADFLSIENKVITYEVHDVELGYLGNVCKIETLPHQTLLSVCSQEGKTFSLPFVPAFILHIEHDTQTITVRIPAGLLNL